jgi:tRNA pseudouridine55 synthase
MLDKSLGASSNAALQQAKRLFNADKAGHGGTLDPLATGLLPVLLGEATKFSSDLLEADKSYVAELKLGVSTATADAEGAVLETRPVLADRARIAAALSAFRGNILQTPPLYSALKHQGRPLYAYARAGIDIERKPRPVSIRALDIVRFEGEQLTLSVSCSKGTYIRTLAHDLGELLGCGAHLSALRRTRIGHFGLDAAHTLEGIGALSEAARDLLLLPVDALLQDLPVVSLAAAEALRFTQGQAVKWPGSTQGRLRVYGADGRLLGLGDGLADGQITPRRLLSQASAPQAGAAAEPG